MAKYKFQDIAINCTAKKVPSEDEFKTYIGLEHMDSHCIFIKRWGSEVPIIGEKLIMHKGDVLLGKRNAYLRRAAIAPHDGVFSAHGMVLRPKTEVIDEKFFPLFIASDYFFDEAIKISVGSLSPTINWKDLKEVEFELPSMEEQRKLADILWAIEETKESYSELVSRTDDLVKSQFIEMFGGGKCPQKKIRELFVLQMGKTPERKNLAYWDSDDYRWISIADLGNYDKYTGATNEHISQFAVDHSGIKIVPKDTVIMSFKLTIGRTAITSEDIYTNEAIMAFIPKEDEILQEFLLYALRYKDWSKGLQNAVKGVTLNKDLIGDARIIVPEKQAQLAFLSFMQQIDKSKYSEEHWRLAA